MDAYRKKTVEITAVQFDGDNHEAIISWINGPDAPIMGGKAMLDRAGNIRIDDPVNEGAHDVLPGDWVIRGVSGEFYGCKPEIFEATYENSLTGPYKRILAQGLHPSTVQLLELFEFDHLPPHLQEISQPFHDLAWRIAQTPTQRGAEQTTCLRKLVEGKDCAVRMGVPLGKIGSNSPPIGG